MGYEVLIMRKALKQLDALDPPTRKRVTESLISIRDEGLTYRHDIKKLKGFVRRYRLRVGKFRVIFELQGRKVIVVAVLPRERAYE